MTAKSTINCGECLDIQHAEELKQRFMDAVDKEAGQYTINASKVSKVDSAGVQIIIAFLKHVTAKGAKVSWKQPSEALVSSALLLGAIAPLELQTFLGAYQ